MENTLLSVIYQIAISVKISAIINLCLLSTFKTLSFLHRLKYEKTSTILLTRNHNFSANYMKNIYFCWQIRIQLIDKWIPENLNVKMYACVRGCSLIDVYYVYSCMFLTMILDLYNEKKNQLSLQISICAFLPSQHMILVLVWHWVYAQYAPCGTNSSYSCSDRGAVSFLQYLIFA